jgi:hypothetical protein
VTSCSPVYDRVVERRRAVALAQHSREAEGLSTLQIADRLGRSSATIKAYFYDPTGEKARAVKARCVGVCRGCGAYTQPRNGKGTPTGAAGAAIGAIQRRWTRALVLAAMFDWLKRYGSLLSSGRTPGKAGEPRRACPFVGFGWRLNRDKFGGRRSRGRLLAEQALELLERGPHTL